jgi:hypothetical protein
MQSQRQATMGASQGLQAPQARNQRSPTRFWQTINSDENIHCPVNCGNHSAPIPHAFQPSTGSPSRSQPLRMAPAHGPAFASPPAKLPSSDAIVPQPAHCTEPHFARFSQQSDGAVLPRALEQLKPSEASHSGSHAASTSGIESSKQSMPPQNEMEATHGIAMAHTASEAVTTNPSTEQESYRSQNNSDLDVTVDDDGDCSSSAAVWMQPTPSSNTLGTAQLSGAAHTATTPETAENFEGGVLAAKHTSAVSRSLASMAGQTGINLKIPPIGSGHPSADPLLSELASSALNRSSEHSASESDLTSSLPSKAAKSSEHAAAHGGAQGQSSMTMTEEECLPIGGGTATHSLPLEHETTESTQHSFLPRVGSSAPISHIPIGLKLAEWNLQAASVANAAAGRSGKLHEDSSPIALPDNYNPDASSHHLVRACCFLDTLA